MEDDENIIISKKKDWKDLPYPLKESVGACLFGCPGRDTYLIVFFNEDWFYEAGVAYFGNSGDVTAENAIYWERAEETRYFNKGWMIWGSISFRMGRLWWIPDDELNRENEDSLGWFSEEYGERDVEVIFQRRKRFTRSFDRGIMEFLKDIRVDLLDGYI